MSLLARSKQKDAVLHARMELVETAPGEATSSSASKGPKKSPFRTVAGLYLGESEIILTRVALTPIGPRQVSSESVPYSPDPFEEVLQRLLSPFLSKRGIRAPIAVGLPMHRVIFTTRARTANTKDTAPSMLLHKALRSSNVNVDDMEDDIIKSRPGKRPLPSLAACRRRSPADVLSSMGNCGLSPFRA